MITHAGTSPRTRGKPTVSITPPRSARNIPAHAGKTKTARDRRAASAEHPRARGKNPGFPPRGSERQGTSPRTRGKHLGGAGKLDRTRNIPAHAGKTPVSWQDHRHRPEHPRARGENHSGTGHGALHAGTSPRTRGKHDNTPPYDVAPGNIPAHAGKTAGPRWASTRSTEHPRARGENTPRLLAVNGMIGTSPRTRGKLVQIHEQFELIRNIPAHAGKTRRRGRWGFSRREHPRARGENCYRGFTATHL